MQSIYNRIEVDFAHANLYIFEKQNLMSLYNKANEEMYKEWDNLTNSKKEYYLEYDLYTKDAPKLYQFRKEWIERNLDKEEYRPLIEGFKSYYNL